MRLWLFFRQTTTPDRFSIYRNDKRCRHYMSRRAISPLLRRDATARDMPALAVRYSVAYMIRAQLRAKDDHMLYERPHGAFA